MKGKPATSSRGAVATGAAATGAASLAAVAAGAAALGALAIGALAIGRLSVGRARLRRVEIGELAVGRLEIGARGQPAAVLRLRATAGSGDALERLVREEDMPGVAPWRALRSQSDPDVFLFEAFGVEAAAGAGSLHALLRRAAAAGLIAPSDKAPLEIELYRTI
ncbi:MAG TPA: hypothetical protein VFN28_01260 [Amaricoccus sp.]|nr:hypothetical protein [Amaricoccus sp.]